ncbi:hypothetical protein H206_01935 [Candidatus Electrothrix aarhusensis]|uniref:Uncharacterized protein n=1 Tax=Candidatus Electrothrix aarhusensis TaxID=1859131 RepID=A0A3S3RS89_9BACT|nr:hypothetical protein H206_01935 [Candidatus Electrothrix aarhusensis]
MGTDKFQVKEKANYLRLILLRDDLQHYDQQLLIHPEDAKGFINKLRNTRGVILILENVRDAIHKINLRGEAEYVKHSRELRKDLAFVNHFRNKAVGHLDHTLLERAVQWSPSLFMNGNETIDETVLIDSQKAIIESAINSYIDSNGNQKQFNTEIDLFYPPDYDLFYSFLQQAVNDSINWLTESIEMLSQVIKFHSDEELKQLASVAGQTNFNLKEESDLSYDETESKKRFESTLEKLKEIETNPDILEFINKKLKI